MELSWPRSAFIDHLQMPSESGDELNLTVNNPYCDLTLEAMSLMKQLNVGARTCSGSVPLQTESLNILDLAQLPFSNVNHLPLMRGMILTNSSPIQPSPWHIWSIFRRLLDATLGEMNQYKEQSFLALQTNSSLRSMFGLMLWLGLETSGPGETQDKYLWATAHWKFCHWHLLSFSWWWRADWLIIN